ncbi:unnamed protein product [Rotaria socialis]
MAESMNASYQFPNIPFNSSTSFHSTAEGKVWTRLLIHLCWWLHDMYEIDGTDSKFDYIEKKIDGCRTLFPGEFKLMFSDTHVSPAEQHPLLICRQDEQKIIILVFRATISSKSIQDVFTDASIYSNHQVYLGARHAGFAKRAESAPLIAVTNWLRRGWKIIITGHSLGGAVSQLFTAQVISNLVEAGLLPEMVSLRCITFGTPQCADYHFWSSYTDWYGVFDTYIYQYDAIFRLATFGADVTKEVTDSFSRYLQKLGIKAFGKVIGYKNEDLTSIFVKATDQICNFCHDALLPAYSIFGRHHFIRKDEKSELKIDSVGELADEKEQLLKNLAVGRHWYDYLIERKLIPNQFTFVYREFMEHGCYPFAINQLFNREATPRLSTGHSMKQKLLRIEAKNNRGKRSSAADSVSNINAIVNLTDESSLSRIYFQGFLVDFIIAVKLPNQLAESEQSREITPVLSQEKPDVCTVLYRKSDASTKYLRENSSFEVNVRTYFGSFNIKVAVLTNFHPEMPSVYQLDPIATVFRAYGEFVLDASSTEQIDSPLSRCFRSLFAAFDDIGHIGFDAIMARYLVEKQSRNLCSDAIRDLPRQPALNENDTVENYFDTELTMLKQTAENNKDSEQGKHALFLYEALLRELEKTISSPTHTTDEDSTQGPELVPLHLNFIQLHRHLQDLHTDFNVCTVQEKLKAILAPFIFIIIKLERLEFIERWTFGDHVAFVRDVHSRIFRWIDNHWYVRLPTDVFLGFAKPLVYVLCYYPSAVGIGGARYGLLNDYKKTLKSLKHISASLLVSTGEVVHENENEWQILNRVAECDWSRKLTQAKSSQEQHTMWAQTFTSEPLKEIPSEYQCKFISVIQMCCQLSTMREILAGQPPKVVITGQSQTGKSTLFEYLTGRNLKELCDVTNFNTRMSLQCPAFIKLDDEPNDGTLSDGSVLPIHLVDSPGDDDATGQSGTLLDLSLHAANLFILVTALTDVNQKHTIALLNKILKDTRVKILVLINKVDLRLKEAWKKIRKGYSYRRQDSDDEDTDNHELDQVFSLCKTLDEMVKRPREELIDGLEVDRTVVNNRVTFQTVILTGFNEFYKTFDEPGFREKVHKSNVNKWIKQNLINSTD